MKRIEPVRAAVSTAATVCANGAMKGKTPVCDSNENRYEYVFSRLYKIFFTV